MHAVAVRTRESDVRFASANRQCDAKWAARLAVARLPINSHATRFPPHGQRATQVWNICRGLAYLNRTARGLQ